MSNLTVKQLGDIARHLLGTRPRTPIELLELVNLAGEHLMSARQWQWAEGRSVRIRPRASITLEGATWTEATKTLTKTGAFEDYDFLSADTIEVTDGTGATVGTYEVASRTSDNAIVLVTSIGAAADAQTDIDATMPNDQVALPGDFSLQQITAYSAVDGLVGAMSFVGAQEMLELRSLGALGSTAGFWALLRHVRSSAGGQPVPRLELWPTTDDESESLVIFYRGGWLPPSSDTVALSLPNWLNALMVEVFKAVVEGHEKPELGSVDARLTALRSGVLWADAVAMDSAMQSDMGPRRNCWLDSGASVGRYDVPPPIVGLGA